jgi:pimeloyl-ACP methyl ester carboxylesterase
MHVLEAGFDPPQRPLVLLLHGFPELAYSWRKILLPSRRRAPAWWRPISVATASRAAGIRATTVTSIHSGCRTLVRDALGLVAALGETRVHAVVGHDFGSPVAGWCSVIRPDVFAAVVMMSAPFGGPPPLPSGVDVTAPSGAGDVHAEPGAAGPAAQALPVVLLDPGGRSGTCSSARRVCMTFCAPTTT